MHTQPYIICRSTVYTTIIFIFNLSSHIRIYFDEEISILTLISIENRTLTNGSNSVTIFIIKPTDHSIKQTAHS